MADSINNLCPIIMDSLTSITSAYNLSDTVFQFNCRINIDGKKYDLKKMKNIVDKEMLVNIQGNAFYSALRKYKIWLIFTFVDENDKFLFKSELLGETVK